MLLVAMAHQIEDIFAALGRSFASYVQIDEVIPLQNTT